MPRAIEAIRLPDDDANEVVNPLLQRLDRKMDRNLLRARYYDGKHFNRLFKTAVVPLQYQRLGIVLGWSAKAVDLLAKRCNLDGFVWEDGDLDSLGSREVFENNNFRSETNQGLVSMLIHSCVFLVNTEGDTSDDEAPAYLHYKDAMNATGDWDTRRRRLRNLVSINDRDKDGQPTSLTLYEYNVTRTYVKTGRGWSTEDVAVHDFGVPADLLPWHPRLGREFGMSRISRPVMSAQNSALRTTIRMEGHLDVYSFPEFWMLGADASIFKDKDGNLKPEWQVMLGRIKGIPDDDEAENPRADVKQFPASDPSPHLSAFKQQAQSFSGETSIPLNSLGVSDMTNPTSADSYTASREDLIAEAEGTVDDVDLQIRRRYLVALAMQNGLSSVPDEWKTLQSHWRNPVHLSRAAQADAGAKNVGAIPWLAETAVGLELQGLSPDQIRRAMAEKRRLKGSDVLNALRQAAGQAQLPGNTPDEQGVTSNADTGGTEE